MNEELRHRNRELADVSNDLANVFASTLIPIVIVDPALTIRRFTPAIDRMMRMVPSDLGRALGDIKLRFDLPDLEARVGATIATLVPSQADVQDDQGRWWALTVRPYLTVDRKLDGAVLVFTDIDVTKRYAAEEAQLSEHRRQLLLATEAARSEASAANLAKMGFLANMSHDLRTPLNAIAGYADLMALRIHGELTSAQEVDLARITRSARHLLSLINDILNYAKIESGKLNLVVVPVSVTDAMTALEEVVFPQVQARGLSLALHACEGVILADREKLQQILLNLVTNSIKFTVAGGIEVRCSSTDATVRIEVSDTGTGIAADQLDRIFEPFIQVSRGLTSAAHDGVGLGLSISRDLARAMGGDITVQSMLSRGSVFAVTLPGGVE
ncbi:MAG: ATP-binding protein [Gemmatimonadaceae bacterium]